MLKIATCYKDGDDRMRGDPMFKLATGRLPDDPDRYEVDPIRRTVSRRRYR